MRGKVASALIRREADAYRAQGLQEEALMLLRNILSSQPDLHPDVKKGIEEQIRQIEAEMSGTGLDEHQQLSEEQIAIIREGWSESATIEDFVVCGQALHALGRHRDALAEFRTSIQKGYSAHRVIAPLADCLVHLHAPHELPGRLTEFTAGLFQSSKESFHFMLALSEQMLADGDREHAAALGRHLAEFKGVPPNSRMRLDTMLKTLKSSPASAPSILQRIRDALRSWLI